MPFANLEIIRVMSRGNLNNAGTKLHIDIFILNDRNRLVHDRKPYHSALQISISFILRINCDRRIPEHCLWSCCCKFQKFRLARLPVLIHERIFDMPEMARLLLVFHFRIGNGRITYRTPVNDSAALINPSFFVHLTEHFRDRLIAALVHRKTFSVPVAGRTQLFQLADNSAAVFLFPFPCPFQEAISA